MPLVIVRNNLPEVSSREKNDCSDRDDHMGAILVEVCVSIFGPADSLQSLIKQSHNAQTVYKQCI